MPVLSQDFIWWLSAVDLPVLGALFGMIWRTREEGRQAVDALEDTLEKRSSQLRDALAAFKLEVAKTYASHTDLRELETRLVAHLLRIEAKLDATALKAASLKSGA